MWLQFFSLDDGSIKINIPIASEILRLFCDNNFQTSEKSISTDSVQHIQ